jgi:hypothetical protein
LVRGEASKEFHDFRKNPVIGAGIGGLCLVPTREFYHPRSEAIFVPQSILTGDKLTRCFPLSFLSDHPTPAFGPQNPSRIREKYSAIKRKLSAMEGKLSAIHKK